MPTENNIESIARHIAVLNDEVGKVKIDLGKVKNDIHWLKRIIGYTAVIITGVFISVVSAVVKFLFFP